MAKFPGKYPPGVGRYNISDTVSSVVETNGIVDFRGYGSDYSANGGMVIYIGSAPLERIVAFKAFIESFKLNLTKEVDIEGKANRNYKIIKEGHGLLSYDLAINIPAHSTNEARNNLAKIEELQRLILPGAAWKATTNLDETKLSGVSQRSATTTPLFHVYFKNLINSGYDGVFKKISSYTDLMKAGFTCYIEGINYEPEEEAGYFKIDNFLFPKNIKLTLKLNYESESLYSSQDALRNRRTILPFQTNGHYSDSDSSLFPFGVKVSRSGNSKFGTLERPKELLSTNNIDFSLYEMNTLSQIGQRPLDSYVFISLPVNPIGESSYAAPAEPKTFNSAYNEVFRFVMFKPFVENFSRNVKVSVKTKGEEANQSIAKKVAQNGINFDILEYTLRLNIPAENLLEAKKNCGKLQYLMRMFYKKFYDGTTGVKQGRDDLTLNDQLSKLMVYIPNMIESPHKPSAAPSGADMKNITIQSYQRAVPLYLRDFSIDFDLDLGFFEEDSRIYPKSLTIDLIFIYDKADLIRNYSFLGSHEAPIYTMPKGSLPESSVIDDSNAWLFPFNRKTVKIGGA